MYDKKTVSAIAGGAAAGIAVGGAAAIGLAGYGGKKGYPISPPPSNFRFRNSNPPTPYFL